MLSKEERAEICRENGRCAQGALTPETRKICSMNALRHGMAAESWTLNSEPVDLAPSRLHDWVSRYKPDSPAALHPLKVCVQSTLTHDRCWAALTGAVAAQSEEVSDAWHAAQAEVADEFMALLPSSPAVAVAGLKRSAAGCRRVLAALGDLGEAFACDGYWTPEAAEQAVRFFGFDAALDRLGAHDLPFRMVLFNLHCQPWTADTERRIVDLSVPERRPVGLRGVDLASVVPPAAECREWLRRLIAAECQSVALLEETFRNGKDQAGYKRVMERTQMLAEGERARMHFRYSKETNSTFLRYHKELMATLKRDAEAAQNAAETDSPDRTAPDPTAATVTAAAADPGNGAEAGSRNEPNDGATVTRDTLAVGGEDGIAGTGRLRS
jgi:hypothetical protein